MRILILTPRVPWPPRDGGRVAMARGAVSLVHGGAAVEVLSLNPRKHRVAVGGPLPVAAVDIDTSRIIGPLLRSAFTRLPFIVARFVSRRYGRALVATLARFRPDVVQIESPFLLPYASTIRRHSDARIVLRSQNVEFRIWEGLARNADGTRRLALQRVAASLRRYELRAMAALDGVVPISEADADDFRQLGCDRPMLVMPCGVDIDDEIDVAPKPLTVGFIGSLDFRPNQEAAAWIVDELWPRVREQLPEARLMIAGSAPPAWLRDRARDAGVELLGNVDDAAAFVRSLAVVVAPLFAGGGMRIKVLEAMALGKAVVATTIGAGGVAVEHDRDIVIAEDAASFAAAVVALLRDPARAARLGAAARTAVAARYDNDVLGRALLRFYETL